MSTVTIALPAGGAVASALNKVTLRSSTGTLVTLPITDANTQIENLAPNWVSVDRPGLVEAPFMIRGPRPLHKLTLTVHLVNQSDMTSDIESLLTDLANVTQSDTITLAYGSFESSSAITTGGFVCTEFTVTVTVRDPSTNKAIQGTATIELTEANPPPTFVPQQGA